LHSILKDTTHENHVTAHPIQLGTGRRIPAGVPLGSPERTI
jgi:hypothetical protein